MINIKNIKKILKNDSLEYFWNEQNDFQRLIFNTDISKLSLDEKRRLTKEFILHITTEFDELLKAIGGWKIHKPEDTIPKKKDITEEITDILKFLINICLIWNITPNELIETFIEKSIVNRQLFIQQLKFEAIKKRKVVIFDIDGVLNNYPEEFIKYINKNLKTKYKIKDYLNIKKKIPIEKYNNLKTRFREEYQHKILPEAIDILRKIDSKGINIILLTSRSYQEHKYLATKLIYQLYIQDVPYDMIIFNNEKDIIAKQFSDVLFAIDDEPENIIKYNNIGIKSFLLLKPYNLDFKDKLPCIERLDNIIKYL